MFIASRPSPLVAARTSALATTKAQHSFRKIGFSQERTCGAFRTEEKVSMSGKSNGVRMQSIMKRRLVDPGPSVDDLVAVTGFSRAKVIRLLADLEAAGAIRSVSDGYLIAGSVGPLEGSI